MATVKTREEWSRLLDEFINGECTIKEFNNRYSLGRVTIKRWAEQGNWDKLKLEILEQNVKKCAKNEAIFLDAQKELTYRACLIMLDRIKEDPWRINDQNMINLIKHGLEVVRPKTMAQLNSIKQTNILVKPEKAKQALEVLKRYERRITKSVESVHNTVQ